MNLPCSAAGKRKKGKGKHVSIWLTFKEKLMDKTFSLDADDFISVEEDV